MVMASLLLSSSRLLVLLPPPSSNTCCRRVSGRVGFGRCEAVGGEGSGSLPPDPTEAVVYNKGVYGPWTVDESDVREVILYRSGLVTAAASFVIASSTAFLPQALDLNQDFLYTLGAGGLGLSLFFIHIYVTPIKRFIQSLWALGAVGSLATYFSLAHPLHQSLLHYVIDNPLALWFVGPLFAALTALVFKEGLCYGKLEAAILTFIIPTLLLGHLSGLMDNEVKLSLLGVWMALFVIFAARKFQQPIKDDIGDKSVFVFNALPEEEKKALLQKLEERNYKEELD